MTIRKGAWFGLHVTYLIRVMVAAHVTLVSTTVAVLCKNVTKILTLLIANEVTIVAIVAGIGEKVFDVPVSYRHSPRLVGGE